MLGFRILKEDVESGGLIAIGRERVPDGTAKPEETAFNKFNDAQGGLGEGRYHVLPAGVGERFDIRERVVQDIEPVVDEEVPA